LNNKDGAAWCGAATLRYLAIVLANMGGCHDA